nr:MAG TPA: hypothetical protein [Caudoviricetes sp.]
MQSSCSNSGVIIKNAVNYNQVQSIAHGYKKTASQ